MFNKYQIKNCSNAKYNAQLNLEGRTSYVNDDTLRFHHARINGTYITDGGLLFALIESVALDPDNTKRGHRYVIFDIFGHVIDRPDLDQCYKSADQARKAMWIALNNIDAQAVTREGIERQRAFMERELQYVEGLLNA